MLFTWDTRNLCIVFRQWHVRSTFGLVVSLLAVVALAAGYEALRAATRKYENIVNKRVEAQPSKPCFPLPVLTLSSAPRLLAGRLREGWLHTLASLFFAFSPVRRRRKRS